MENMSRMKVDLDKIAEGISSNKLSKLRKRNRDLFKEKPNESVQSGNSVLSNNETTTETTDEKSAKVVDWNDQLRQWQKNTSIIEFKKILQQTSDRY